VLRIIFGSPNEEVPVVWRTYRLYSWPNGTSVNTLWSGHAARMREKRNAFRFFAGNLKEGNHLT
jgi:hypothetical protein